MNNVLSKIVSTNILLMFSKKSLNKPKNPKSVYGFSLFKFSYFFYFHDFRPVATLVLSVSKFTLSKKFHSSKKTKPYFLQK